MNTFKNFLKEFLFHINSKRPVPKPVLEMYKKIYQEKIYLNSYYYQYKIPSFLFNYQVEGVKFALFVKRAALFWEQGLGKTLAGLTFAHNSPAPVLIVTKKRIIENWLEHEEKYFNNTLLEKGLEVINYERLEKISSDKKVFKTIIFDESHSLKNWKAKRTRLAYFLAQKAENVLLLSGTPITKNPIDLYTQIKILYPEIFGTKADFLNRYVIFDKSGKFPVAFKNIDKLYNRVKLVAQTLKKEDLLNLPDKVIDLIYLSKTPEQSSLIEKIEKEWPNINNPLTLTLRLHQVACGFFEETEVPTEKLDYLEDYLKESDGQVIIFYQFKKEGNLIESLLKKLNISYIRIEAGRKDDIQLFKSGKVKVLLGNIFSISEGLNLQNCNQAVYFSLPWSYKDFSQSLDRMHRPGQTKTVFINILITKGTIEEEIYKALSKKQDFSARLFIANS